MTIFTLNRGVGPLSAGTVVKIVSVNNQTQTVVIEGKISVPVKHENRLVTRLIQLVVPSMQVTARRERTDEVPAITRAERRAALQRETRVIAAILKNPLVTELK